jgi:hypothetical protein
MRWTAYGSSNHQWNSASQEFLSPAKSFPAGPPGHEKVLPGEDQSLHISAELFNLWNTIIFYYTANPNDRDR